MRRITNVFVQWTMVFGVLSIGLLYQSTGAAAPPLEFKGIPLGATKEELLEKMPLFECRSETLCSISSPNRAVSRACAGQGKSQSEFKDCLARVSESLVFGPINPDAWLVFLRDGRIESFSVLFDGQFASMMKSALIEKYGKPTTENKDAKLNRDHAVSTWRMREGEMNLAVNPPKVPGQPSTGMVEMRVPGAGREEAKRNTKEAAKKL